MRSLSAFLIVLLSVLGVKAAEAERFRAILDEKCALCHGRHGNASSAIYPRLAGQNRVYLEKQLRNFREGTRQSETMTEMAKGLSDADIAALAGYYAEQIPRAHRIRSTRKSLEAVGYYIFHEGNEYSDIPPCTACHGDYGEGDENLPRLAGQHRRYIVDQLDAFHERKRSNDNAVMHTVAKRLTELEINAVALYVSGLRIPGEAQPSGD